MGHFHTAKTNADVTSFLSQFVCMNSHEQETHTPLYGCSALNILHASVPGCGRHGDVQGGRTWWHAVLLRAADRWVPLSITARGGAKAHNQEGSQSGCDPEDKKWLRAHRYLSSLSWLEDPEVQAAVDWTHVHSVRWGPNDHLLVVLAVKAEYWGSILPLWVMQL